MMKLLFSAALALCVALAWVPALVPQSAAPGMARTGQTCAPYPALSDGACRTMAGNGAHISRAAPDICDFAAARADYALKYAVESRGRTPPAELAGLFYMGRSPASGKSPF